MDVALLKPIDNKVFVSEDIVHLAQYLLGKYIVSSIDDSTIVSMITETEAYRGPDDKGSHAYNNRRTDRTEVIFGPAGRSYVYLCYGLHNMLNVVTAPKGIPHAILIRAVQPIKGLDLITERRGVSGYNVTNGPGKLCQALGIDRSHNDHNYSDKNSPVWLAENKEIITENIIASERVGIAYADECAHWPWRFRIKDSKWTSKPNVVSYK